MGRKRKYRNNAERQAALRLRKQRGSDNNVTASGVADPDHSQREWNRNNRATTSRSEASKKVPGKIYLVQLADQAYVLIERLAGVRARKLPVGDLESAELGFQQLVEGDLRDSEFCSVDYYREQAKRVIKQVRLDSQMNPFFSQRYGFLIAAEEVLSEGFDDVPKMRNTNGYVSKHLKTARRKLLSLLGNKKVPSDPQDIRRDFVSALSKISTSKDPFSTRTAELYAFLCCQSIAKTFSALPKQLPHFGGLSSLVFEDTKKFIENNTGTSKKAGLFRAPRPHKFISIDKLEKILGIAFETSYETYNYIVLALTTGLRPEEMERLSHYRSLYLNSDGTLDYKHTGASANVPIPLSVKTEGTVDLDKLPNPTLSVVGRIIINHHQPKLSPENFFKYMPKQKRGFRFNHPDLQPYYERTIRTTAATMLAYCTAADIGRTDLYTVKDRLAHETLEQIIERYATNKPSNLKPEQYFQIGELQRAETGLDLGGNQILWDRWLLRDWISRFKRKYIEAKDNAGLAMMWQKVEQEVRIYKQVTKAEEEVITSKL